MKITINIKVGESEVELGTDFLKDDVDRMKINKRKVDNLKARLGQVLDELIKKEDRF